MKVMWLGVALLGAVPCVSADDGEHVPTQQETQQNKQRVYTKAMLWAVIMGLIGRDAYTHMWFQCKWARRQYITAGDVPRAGEEITFYGKVADVVKRDVKRVTEGELSFARRVPLTARVVFALFGLPFVLQYAVDSWRKAYDTYMRQSRHSMLKPHLTDNVA